MAQNTVNYANNPTGPELLDNYLTKEQENILSSNSGIQRPSYAIAGTPWLDTSVTPWLYKIYDGSGDVIIGAVNSTTHGFVPSGVDESNLVHKTGNETIAGSKTFSSSPSVPTATNGDNSTKAATTAFVQTAVNTRATQADVNLAISNVLSALYPVGSIYIGTQTTCPLASLINGSTWELVAQDRALWGGDGTNANTTIAAGLPNITGKVNGPSGKSATGAFTVTPRTPLTGGSSTSIREGDLNFDASLSNSIYGNSDTVQPPAYVVNIWRRTA